MTGEGPEAIAAILGIRSVARGALGLLQQSGRNGSVQPVLIELTKALNASRLLEDHTAPQAQIQMLNQALYVL